MIAQALYWIYPPKCGLCGRTGPLSICPDCLCEFKVRDSAARTQSGPVSEAIALYQYESRAAQAVRRLKYSRVTTLIDPLAGMVLDAYMAMSLDRFDVVVPIPIHWRRRAMRGFNQSEELASRLPKETVSPHLLKRIRWTQPQVKLDREARRLNLMGAFRAAQEARGKSILLIDDVTTSGQTAEHCALALLDAGAAKVGLLALTGEA